MRSLSLVVGFCVVVFAARLSSAQPLTVTSAHPDSPAGALVINGAGFRNGVVVELEGQALKITSIKSRQIVTSLPSLDPGTYRLVVRDWFQSARFTVAIEKTGGASDVTPALSVVASNGTTLGTLVGVTKLFGTDPAMAARQENGVWITLPVDSSGVQVGSYPIFYTAADCTGDAYALLESTPAPLVRMVQRMTASDTTGYYAGNPTQQLSFPAMQIEDFNNPGTKMCVSAPDYGWGGTLTVGPLQTIDLTQFPAPLTVK